MKVLLDMNDEKFLKLFALQELPGKLLGTELDSTINSVFTSDDIWNRIHDVNLLPDNTCSSIEEYGKNIFLGEVVNHLNKNFDANNGITWFTVDAAVIHVFDDFRDRLAEMKQKPLNLDFHGLHQALSNHRRDLNGNGRFGDWYIFSNSKRGLHNDFQICYGKKPVVSAVVSDEPSPNEYFYIDLHRTSNISDQSFSQLCNIVQSVYSVARIAPDEQVNMESHLQSNSSFELPIDGLHKALERFDSVIEDSITATGICGSWEVARYGTEPGVPVFKIYHDGLPVVSSKIGSEFHSAGSKYFDLSREANLSDNTFSQICDVVKSFYMFARMSPDEQKKIQENSQSQGR